MPKGKKNQKKTIFTKLYYRKNKLGWGLTKKDVKQVGDLMDEHEDDGGVSPTGFGEERESVGVIEELIAKRPIHGGGRRNCESEYIECGHQVNVLELLWFPHSMHYFTVIKHR